MIYSIKLHATSEEGKGYACNILYTVQLHTCTGCCSLHLPYFFLHLPKAFNTDPRDVKWDVEWADPPPISILGLESRSQARRPLRAMLVWSDSCSGPSGGFLRFKAITLLCVCPLPQITFNVAANPSTWKVFMKSFQAEPDDLHFYYTSLKLRHWGAFILIVRFLNLVFY